jgi:hypothetical protein
MLFSITLLTSLFFVSCKEKSTQPEPTPGNYDQMLFDREGGGNLKFTVYPSSSADTFKITITQKEFRDTTIQLNISRTTGCAGVFDTLKMTLNQNIQIMGDFKQSTLPTGTWAYIYVVRGLDKTEVTNTGLRNTLLNFENLVRAKL